MDYLDTIKNKRQDTVEAGKQQSYTDSLNAVSVDIRTLLASLETSGAKKLDKQVVSAISSLASIVETLKTVKISNDEETKHILSQIVRSLDKIDVRPVVNVKAPQVNVTEQKLNLDPLIKALERPEVADDDPLVGYKAQDINNDDPHTQYVGFVNARGNWYIIENNDESNSLRYVFGEGNYSVAFKAATKLNYRLYSEAVNATKA